MGRMGVIAVECFGVCIFSAFAIGPEENLRCDIISLVV